MLLNRIYDEQDLERYKKEREESITYWREVFKALQLPEGLVASFSRQVAENTVPQPKLSGVEVVHTGFSPEQNFSTSLITEFVKLGIAKIEGDQLTLLAEPQDLHYTIKRGPGRWCLHCGEKLPDDTGGELARLHVAVQHGDTPSPVESEPSGYVWLTYFECVLDEAEHEMYKEGA